MKRMARALAGVAVVAALVAASPAAQAAPATKDTAGWSLHFDGLSGTPSPKDKVSNWSGNCAVPGEFFTVFISGEGRTVLWNDHVQCLYDGTCRVSQMHYDFSEYNWRFEKGQTYTANFLYGGDTPAMAEATTTI